MLALKRAAKSLAGQRGELAATIAQNKLKASEIDMQILELKNERLDKITTEMRETQRRRFESADRLESGESAGRPDDDYRAVGGRRRRLDHSLAGAGRARAVTR